MPNVKHIITTKRDEDGKVIVKLYGKSYDVTNQVLDGFAYLYVFGEEYEIRVEDGSTTVKKKPSRKVKVTDKNRTMKVKVHVKRK